MLDRYCNDGVRLIVDDEAGEWMFFGHLPLERGNSELREFALKRELSGTRTAYVAVRMFNEEIVECSQLMLVWHDKNGPLTPKQCLLFLRV
ncbi:MAG TPA: hypothetical protein PLY16_02180 [Candidatus Saccharibacteria bacterium]|nr:hypothetical protein [Candidatus Saccharibacteria bacterium]